MALASENPFLSTIKAIFSPGKNRELLMPAIGVSAVVALFVAHFQLWQVHYAGQLPAMQLQSMTLLLWLLGVAFAAIPVLWLSEGEPQLGLVPVAAVGLVFYDWDLRLVDFPQQIDSWWQLLQTRWAGLAAWLGVWCGLFALPQLGLYVRRTDATTQRRNTVVLLLAIELAIVVGQVGAEFLQNYASQLNPFNVLAACGLAVSLLVLWQLPIAFLQFFAWCFIHFFYRIETKGLDNIPARGPVLLVANHVSFIDSFVVGGTIKRPPRFVMDKGFYQAPVMNWIFRTAKAIPIAPAKKDPEMLAAAYDKIAEELQDGQAVLVFPEGAITWDGEMIDFKEGVERILKRTPVRVVPVALRGLWGSWFSRSGGGTFKGLPRPWKKIQVRAGEIMNPEEATAAELQKRVQALRGQWR